MINNKEYKEVTEKLEEIYLDNLYRSLYYVELEEYFAKDIFADLIQRGILTLYKKLSCVACNSNILYIRNGEIELYKEYFSIKKKKDKIVEDIMTLESLKQIIDLSFICDECGLKYNIENTENIEILEKQNVYKINMSKLSK